MNLFSSGLVADEKGEECGNLFEPITIIFRMTTERRWIIEAIRSCVNDRILLAIVNIASADGTSGRTVWRVDRVATGHQSKLLLSKTG